MIEILYAIALFVVFIVYLFGRTKEEKEQEKETCYREEERDVITDPMYNSVPGNIHYDRFYHGDKFTNF